jgi:hypothetical protein
MKEKKEFNILSLKLLTLHAFTDEHPKPPPVQGSEKEIFTETFKAFVNNFDAVIYAVGGMVSAQSITDIRKKFKVSIIVSRC